MMFDIIVNHLVLNYFKNYFTMVVVYINNVYIDNTKFKMHLVYENHEEFHHLLFYYSQQIGLWSTSLKKSVRY